MVETAVASIGFDGFGDEDFAPTFAQIRKLGLRALELNCWYPRNLTPDGVARAKDRSRAVHVAVVSLHVGSFAAGGSQAAEVSRWLWLVEAATRLGARVLKATGPRRGKDGSLDHVVDTLRAVAPVAADAGVDVVLENHVDNLFETIDDYRWIFAACHEPNVGLCLDTGHFVASGIDPADVVDVFAERILHVDLKDCAKPGGEHFVPFGEGIVDFDALFAQLRRIGYDRCLVVEFPRRSAESMLSDLQAGVAVARRYQVGEQ